MTEEEKLERMRSIPGFVDLPEGWANSIKFNSPLILVKGRLHGEIKRDRYTVSNVGKKMITLRSAAGVAAMVQRRGWNYVTESNYFYWVEVPND